MTVIFKSSALKLPDPKVLSFLFLVFFFLKWPVGLAAFFSSLDHENIYFFFFSQSLHYPTVTTSSSWWSRNCLNASQLPDKRIPASSRNQCLINRQQSMTDENSNETFSYQHLPTPLKEKQNANSQRFPFFHGSLKVFERSWQHGGKHDSATLGILACCLCDSMMWEDSHGSGAGDRRTGSPCSAAHALSTKKQTKILQL